MVEIIFTVMVGCEPDWFMRVSPKENSSENRWQPDTIKFFEVIRYNSLFMEIDTLKRYDR
jgi:hypothetical protein